MTVISQLGRMVIQLAGVVILSRLLSPDDFGLIAMVAVFLALGDLIRDFGLPTAALQARTLSSAQASNLFWMSSGLGLLAATALVLCSPLIVALYSEPRLATVIPVMAFVLLSGGMQAQIQVQLARSMRFASLAFSALGAQMFGLAAAIAAAIAGWGYWALVVQALAVAVSLLVMRSVAAGWVPQLPSRHVGTYEHVRNGGHIGAAQVLVYAANNVDTMMIGAMWGSVPLGYYNRAYQVVVAPLAGFLSPLTQVVIPTLNAARAEGRSVFSLLRRLQLVLSAVLIGGLVTLGATATSLIPLLLGEGWDSIVIIFQLLVVGECFRSLSYVSYWAFLTEQQSKQLFYYNLVSKSLSVALMVGAAFIGVEAVAAAYALGLAISWPLNLAWLARTARLPGLLFLRSGLLVLGAGAVAAAASLLVTRLIPLSPGWSALAVGAAVSLIVFGGLLAAFRDYRSALISSIRYLRRQPS